MPLSTNLKYNEIAQKKNTSHRSREQKVSYGRIGRLQIPQLNIDASSCIDLIDWTDTIVSEPSFTASTTSNNIRKMIKSNCFPFIFSFVKRSRALGIDPRMSFF